MTEQFYCDDCDTFGYVYHDLDENRVELIQGCSCPSLFLLGERN